MVSFPGCQFWTRLDHTLSAGGVYSPAMTDADCQAACLRTPNCLAVDVAPGMCLLHNNSDDLLPKNVFSLANCSTQYRMNTACVTTVLMGLADLAVTRQQLPIDATVAPSSSTQRLYFSMNYLEVFRYAFLNGFIR